MLLSMYLLYRFARSGRSWSYLFDFGLFVVLISFVCAVFPVSEFFIFPLGYLSFPFYVWTGELAAPAVLRALYPWLPYHSVRFLAVDLSLTPDWALSGSGVVTGPEFYGSAVGFVFSVFLLVNVLGGVVGYLVGRRYTFPAWSEGRWLVVGVVSAVVAFVSAVVIVSAFPLVYSSVVESVLTVVFGFGVVVVGAVFLSFLVDLAERARVSSLLVLGGLVFVLAGGKLGQVVVVTIGWALFVLGGVMYFGRATVDYVRMREARAREEAGAEPEAED